MNKKILSTCVFFLIIVFLTACSADPQGLDITSTYVVANVLATRTAQATSINMEATLEAQTTRGMSLTATPPPSAGLKPTVLFFDDFSDLSSGWDEESDQDGGRGYTQGGYHIYVNKAEWCYWTSISRTYSDIVIEVDAQKLSGVENNEFGVISRYNADNDFYYFGISSDGYYGIGKFVDDEWIDLGEEGSGFNDRVIRGGTAINHLKATANYENLSLEVNGSTLMDITDPKLRSGDVGLYVCTYEDATDILFDNFKVTQH